MPNRIPDQLCPICVMASHCLILYVGLCISLGLYIARADLGLPESPNVVIFLADDFGYGDLRTYGHPTQEDNEIDRMASEGMVFRNFYAADSVCSPSRAALLTGRLPARVGIYSAVDKEVRTLQVTMPTGLSYDEVTLPEALSELGYTTGMIGKWHLGINKLNSSDGYYLPTHRFDYVGLNLPFTNELTCDESFRHLVNGPQPQSCFLYNSDVIVQQPINHENLTKKMIAQSAEFITNHKDGPFFLYFGLLQTHTVLFSSPPFQGTSKRILYGDSVNEMAWAVGETLDLLTTLGIDNRTLVLFSSDNGPHVQMCEEGGDSGVLSGGKFNYFEGGIRVPFIAWMPGSIAPSLSDEIATHMDIFPTIVELAGGELDEDRIYDGLSLTGLLFQNDSSPHDIILHYCSQYLFAARKGNLKFVYRTHEVPTQEFLQCSCPGGIQIDSLCSYDFNEGCSGEGITVHDPPLVFNLDVDPGEIWNLTGSDFTDEKAELSEYILEFEATFDLGEPALDGDMTCDVVPCCNLLNDNCVCQYEGNNFTEGGCF